MRGPAGRCKQRLLAQAHAQCGGGARRHLARRPPKTDGARAPAWGRPPEGLRALATATEPKALAGAPPPSGGLATHRSKSRAAVSAPWPWPAPPEPQSRRPLMRASPPHTRGTGHRWGPPRPATAAGLGNNASSSAPPWPVSPEPLRAEACALEQLRLVSMFARAVPNDPFKYHVLCVCVRATL